MSATLQTFTFAPGFDLRVIDQNGDPWFVAKDVCTVLGIANTTMALRTLDADEQALNTVEGISRGNPRVNVVNESGLYSLILKSRKPEAKAFKKWVTSEVLPSIRKHGGYLAPAVAQEDTESPEAFMARAVLMANETIQKLQARTKGLEPPEEATANLLLKDWLNEVGLSNLTTAQRAAIGLRARTMSDLAGRPREYQTTS